jgi:hypothetical protein
MRKYHFVAAAWVMIGSQAFGQTVEKGPNKLGLDIESVTVDTSASTAKIVVRNTSGVPITAYVVDLAPAYSDGERLSGESLIDFFAGLGMKRLIPEGPGFDPNVDAITSGMSRESTFLYEKAKAAGAQLASIRVEVTGIIFDDESTAGDTKRIGEIVQHRDAESAEVARWCADVKRFSDGPVARKAVNDMLAVHAPVARSSGPQPPGQGVTEVEKKEMTSLFQQGLKWQSDDTSTLDPFILDILDAKCAIAKQHLEKRGQ